MRPPALKVVPRPARGRSLGGEGRVDGVHSPPDPPSGRDGRPGKSLSHLTHALGPGLRTPTRPFTRSTDRGWSHPTPCRLGPVRRRDPTPYRLGLGRHRGATSQKQGLMCALEDDLDALTHRLPSDPTGHAEWHPGQWDGSLKVFHEWTWPRGTGTADDDGSGGTLATDVHCRLSDHPGEPCHRKSRHRRECPPGVFPTSLPGRGGV